MTTAQHIVKRLIEDDEDFNPEQYIDDLSTTRWQLVDLVTNAEWRAWLQEVGLKFTRVYKVSRQRNNPEKYRTICVLRLHADSGDRELSWKDECAVAEHLYRHLEKKFGYERNEAELRYFISVNKGYMDQPGNSVEIDFTKQGGNFAFSSEKMYPLWWYDLHSGKDPSR